MINEEEIRKHKLLLTLWKEAIKLGNINKAVMIDFKHYNEIVKPIESQEFWDKWQEDTYKTRCELTKIFEKILPTKNNVLNSDRILIVFHNYSGLAHETQLARNLQFIKSNNVKFEINIVYLFDGDESKQEIASKLYEINKSSIYFLQAKTYTEAGKKLNWIVNNKNYATVLYPSTYQVAYWMSLYVDHNNQKFLQMKYFPSQTGRLVSWGCGRKNNDEFYVNNNFQFIQMSVLNPKVKKISAIENKNINIINRNKINFGSISRPEKIADPKYNELILNILNEQESTCYLYAGRKNNIELIPQMIRSHSRSKYLGWVNPLEAIQIYDIYIEPFPWGGGDMTFLALESGCPYLILDTPQNRVVGIFSFIKFLSFNSNKILEYSFCSDQNIYNNRLKELITNIKLRKELGKAWAEIIDHYEPQDVDVWINFLLK